MTAATPVTPCAGVWIEMPRPPKSAALPVSLPVRECGLKYLSAERFQGVVESLPVRECGLKCRRPSLHQLQRRVTPCAGVWIEMTHRR